MLNLGASDYRGTLKFTTNSEYEAIVFMGNNAVMNMYNGVSICDSSSTYHPGGVYITGNSTFNMYGGTIRNCVNRSTSTSGGVSIIDKGTFNMYDGLIEDCSGVDGGAVTMSTNWGRTHCYRCYVSYVWWYN